MIRIHTYMILTAAVLVTGLTGCVHKHKWAEANCQAPATCTICGETQGETGDHSWKEATCTEPKTCIVCGKTEGSAPGHQWEPATTKKPKTCSVCRATEGEPLKKVTVSEWGYPAIWFISDQYLMVKDPATQKLYLIDYDGNRILPEAFSENIETEWDWAALKKQDGCFVCRVDNKDGTYHSYLIDPNLNVLINYSDPEGYIWDYRDNCWEAIYSKDNRIVIYPMKKDASEIKGLNIDLDAYFYFGNMGYGTIVCRRKNMKDEEDNTDRVLQVDLSTDELSMVSKHYKVKKEQVRLMSASVNKEGWIPASLGNWEAAEKSFDFNNSSFGFYNIKTNKFIPGPEKAESSLYQTEENGCSDCVVIEGLVALSEENSDADKSLFRIFSLESGDYLTEDAYLYVNLGLQKYILVQNTEQKWGYLNNDTFRHEGEWFEDASDFCNGYAMVHKDGKEFLINENLEIVSEGFEGERASVAYTDYVDAYKENMFPVFRVYDGENYHIATVE